MSSTAVFFEGKYLTFLCISVLHKYFHCTKAYTNIFTLYFVLQQSHQYDVNNGAVSSLKPKGMGHIFLFRNSWDNFTFLMNIIFVSVPSL